MDHIYVEENQIADRYVMGTLPADEAERFENHYLSCPECLDRLELAESVQRGFKRMAGQDAVVRQLAVVAWLARLGRMGQLLVLLAFVLLPAANPAGLEVHSAVQLAQARSTLKQERQRSAAAGDLRAELGRERASGPRARPRPGAGWRRASRGGSRRWSGPAPVGRCCAPPGSRGSLLAGGRRRGAPGAGADG